MAKCCDNRPSDLRDYAAKKESLNKETTVAIYKADSASYPCRAA